MKNKVIVKRLREALVGVLCGAMLFSGPGLVSGQSPFANGNSGKSGIGFESAQSSNQVGNRVTASPARATRPTQPAPMGIGDVALQNGALSGQVVNVDGAPFRQLEVRAIQGNQVMGVTQTDENGWFAIKGLRGGVYQIQTPVGGSPYRVWSDGAAPPAARPHALLVSDGQIVRGQGALRRILTSPWVWGIGIAAAIAIPLALANRSDDQPNGS